MRSDVMISCDQTWLLFLVLSNLACGWLLYRQGYKRGKVDGLIDGSFIAVMHLCSRAEANKLRAECEKEAKL